VAETVATETGANTAVLDPIEGLVQGSSQDYLSIMRTNLSNVKKGQGCK
jgi:zinc transport system substrate-binding protein